MKEKKPSRLLTLKEVSLVYNTLYEEGIVSFPLTREAQRKLDALLSWVNNTYFERSNYPTVEEKALALLYFIIKDHPFTDGNKRTAVIVFNVFCEVNNLRINTGIELDQLAVYIEATPSEVDPKEIISDLIKIVFVEAGYIF
jgi:death-on-curing family protein